jgi:hypothetical protein
VYEKRLREPGHADDQAVAAGEQRDERLLDDLVLPDDQLPQLGDDLLVPRAQPIGEGAVIGVLKRDLLFGGGCHR